MASALCLHAGAGQLEHAHGRGPVRQAVSEAPIHKVTWSGPCILKWGNDMTQQVWASAVFQDAQLWSMPRRASTPLPCFLPLLVVWPQWGLQNCTASLAGFTASRSLRVLSTRRPSATLLLQLHKFK